MRIRDTGYWIRGIGDVCRARFMWFRLRIEGNDEGYQGDVAEIGVRRQEYAMESNAYNAGEIVFDRVLIECLPREKVTLVVRGAPVINDATRVDAAAVGLDTLVNIIDNGSDIPGTVVNQCSPTFQACFAAADMVIAKGQGNFETLSEVQRPIYYLFVAKCLVVAHQIGCVVDTPVFQYLGAQ
jgi:hypothetical protein